MQVFPLLPGLEILWHMPPMVSAVIRDLIEEARSAGVSFRVEGTRLHFEAAALRRLIWLPGFALAPRELLIIYGPREAPAPLFIPRLRVRRSPIFSQAT